MTYQKSVESKNYLQKRNRLFVFIPSLHNYLCTATQLSSTTRRDFSYTPHNEPNSVTEDAGQKYKWTHRPTKIISQRKAPRGLFDYIPDATPGSRSFQNQRLVEKPTASHCPVLVPDCLCQRQNSKALA